MSSRRPTQTSNGIFRAMTQEETRPCSKCGQEPRKVGLSWGRNRLNEQRQKRRARRAAEATSGGGQ
jgi:hypothetical protein